MTDEQASTEDAVSVAIEREVDRIMVDVRKLWSPWTQGSPGPVYADVQALRRSIADAFERVADGPAARANEPRPRP